MCLPRNSSSVFAPQNRVGVMIPAQQAQRGGGYVLRRKAEVLEDHFTGSGGAIAVDRNDGSFVTGKAPPSDRRRGFHGDSFANRFRQYALAIRVVLLLEKFAAGHADHSRLHSEALQFLAGLRA